MIYCLNQSYLCKNAASNSNLRQTEIYNVLYTLDNLKKKEILFAAISY